MLRAQKSAAHEIQLGINCQVLQLIGRHVPEIKRVPQRRKKLSPLLSEQLKSQLRIPEARPSHQGKCAGCHVASSWLTLIKWNPVASSNLSIRKEAQLPVSTKLEVKGD